MLPLGALPSDAEAADSSESTQLDLAERLMTLDDDAVTATQSALQELMKQLEGIRARLDAKATTLLSAAGVSLTLSGTITTNAILNDKIVASQSVLPLSIILCLALGMLVICAGHSVRALLVGPGNPTLHRDAFLLARPKTSAWRQDIALHYHATVEAMETAIAARAPLVEKAQKHFLAFLVSLVILILSALASRGLGTEAAWTGIILTLVAVVAVHTLTNPVKAAAPKKEPLRARVVLKKVAHPRHGAKSEQENAGKALQQSSQLDSAPSDSIGAQRTMKARGALSDEGTHERQAEEEAAAEDASSAEAGQAKRRLPGRGHHGH